VVHSRAGEHILVDVRGLLEARVDIAAAQLEVVAQVRVRAGVEDDVGEGRAGVGWLVVDEWRVVGQGLVEAEDGRQLLIVDLDQVDGLLRDIGVHRCDRGHRVTDEADLAHRQDRHVAEDRPELGLDVRSRGHVLTREHGVDAWECLCRGRVDARDPRVRCRAPQELGVEHARDLDVDRVRDAAGHAFACVDHPRVARWVSHHH
jgi:hypothetical protein